MLTGLQSPSAWALHTTKKTSLCFYVCVGHHGHAVHSVGFCHLLSVAF